MVGWFVCTRGSQPTAWCQKWHEQLVCGTRQIEERIGQGAETRPRDKVGETGLGMGSRAADRVGERDQGGIWRVQG